MNSWIRIIYHVQNVNNKLSYRNDLVLIYHVGQVPILSYFSKRRSGHNKWGYLKFQNFEKLKNKFKVIFN